MTPPTGQPERDAPIRWANVFLWQLSGGAVGAMIPAAVLAVAAALLPTGRWAGLFWLAPVAVLAGMATGGAVGVVIGIADTSPVFGRRRRRSE